ncbi:MAG: hypothetical protein COB22_08780 [Cycloclasticus sp.]|nr:MAG: hypothetical protein COB22_08780 [Cycloclasticus sp.]
MANNNSPENMFIGFVVMAGLAVFAMVEFLGTELTVLIIGGGIAFFLYRKYEKKTAATEKLRREKAAEKVRNSEITAAREKSRKESEEAEAKRLKKSRAAAKKAKSMLSDLDDY